MSADNGYILRQSDDGKYALQEYSTSAEEYPDVNNAAWVFDTVEHAVSFYEDLEMSAMVPSEYGLTVRLKKGQRDHNPDPTRA